MSTEPIVATVVPETERFHFLPDKLGPDLFLAFEQSVYRTADILLPDYKGAYWEFYELSNRGWFLEPQLDPFVAVEVSGNGYEGTVSREAAGIIVTLFAMGGALSHGRLPDKIQRHLTNAYYDLRDFALQHAEAREILAAID